MIIKTLILKSFGKFQNKTIDLQEGLNILYGENESGKSTIHQFIEGMFYGFYKQNLKNKKISDEYEKYFPWDNSKDYSGVMIIKDEEEIRIERNFMKNQDRIQVFNQKSGEEQTEKYPYDPVTKLYQPGLEHLKINLSSYQNTISITQMQSKTSEELAREIKDNIINLGDTKRNDLSVHNIIKIISEKKLEIGTERSKKSNYGRLKETIRSMENEKQNTGLTYKEIKELKLLENQILFELEKLETKKRDIETDMMLLRKRDEIEIMKRRDQIHAEIEEIKQKLNNLELFEEVSIEEINEALIQLNSIGIYKDLAEEENEKLKEMIQKKESILKVISETESIVMETGISERISRDIYKYEELETSKKFSSESIEKEKIEELNEKIIQSKKGLLSNKLMLFIISSLAMVPGVIKLFELLGESFIREENQEKMLASLNMAKEYSLITLLGFLLMLFVAFLVWIQGKGKQNEVDYLEEQINLAIQIETSLKDRVINIHHRQQEILNQYRVNRLEDLYQLRDKRFKEELEYQESLRKIKGFQEDVETIHRNILLKKNKIQEQQNSIFEQTDQVFVFMKKLGVGTEKELKEILDKYDVYKRLEQDKINREYLLSEITKGKEYLTHLDIQIDPIWEEEFKYKEINHSYEELEKELKAFNEEIIIKNKEISTIKTEIISKENGVRKPAIIEEELVENYKDLENMNYKLGTYNLIEEAILSISKNIQENFAPKLNEKISKFIKVATDEKYTDIKVSQDLEVSVVDQESHKLVDVNSLSAGTIDLIYFALRLSIAEIMNPDLKLPIILDDSFVQYDENRLEKVIEFLSKIGRQVILFTCHKRELNVVKKIVGDVHIIDIRT